ncbi:hypothetical protein Tco_1083343 [Tanacetum coccineum]
MTTNKNLSQPSASTPMVIELHKEAQQATSGPTSLGVISEVRADPQPSSVVSASSTKPEANNEPQFDTSLELKSSDDVNEEIKLEDLSKLVKNVDHDFSTSRPTELKELPSKISDINGAVRESKILTNKVAALENLKLDLPAGLLALPEQTVKADVAKAKIKKGKEELIDLLGLDMVERMYKEKVKYDKYYLKMLNRRASRKITNCDVLSRGKGPITLKIRQRLDNLYKTEEELELNLDKPLGEQDPIIKSNTLAKKKRKNVDDLHNHFRSTKRYKTSVQFVDHQVRSVLNEPSLAKGPGLNDLARTFSSFLIAEVDKRNMNPNKQMRLIEQLRQ